MLLALDELLVSYASSVMDHALLKDFTLMSMIIRAVLDAQMNLTLSLSLIAMSVPDCTTYLSLSGDMLLYFCRETISYMT